MKTLTISPTAPSGIIRSLNAARRGHFVSKYSIFRPTYPWCWFLSLTRYFDSPRSLQLLPSLSYLWENPGSSKKSYIREFQLREFRGEYAWNLLSLEYILECINWLYKVYHFFLCRHVPLPMDSSNYQTRWDAWDIWHQGLLLWWLLCHYVLRVLCSYPRGKGDGVADEARVAWISETGWNVLPLTKTAFGDTNLGLTLHLRPSLYSLPAYQASSLFLSHSSLFYWSSRPSLDPLTSY